MEKISSKIAEIVTKSEKGYIEVKRGNQTPLKYNQREILNKINCYLNDQYIERDTDDLFWNIANPRITHFTKLISPDTKDFYPYGLGEHNFLQAWALRKYVTKWFDDNAFYQTLNDVAEGLSTYGSSVWKKIKEEDGTTKLEEVDLLNLYFDQSVSCIRDTDIVEKHYLDSRELWEKDGVWDNVKQLIDLKKDEYEIDEFWGFVDTDGKHEYKHIIVYGSGDAEVILWEEKSTEEECPYIDFHLGRFRGRWMRVGVVERLFKLQARTNELVNQNAQSTAIASLLLLKSANQDITGNVLEQAVNGQIIGDESLQQIGITNTGLNQFIQELQLINQQADRLCLTPEIIQGEASPSNTTFRGIAVVNAGAVTAFKNYRQNLFEKIADILLQDIFPKLVRGWNRSKLIEMEEDDEDVDAYDKAMLRYMKKEALLSGQLVTPEMEQQMILKIQEELNGIGRKVELGDNFFNFKWGFKMMPTDESVDKSATNDAYFNALQMIGANPTLGEIPLFKQYLENNGISPHKMTPKQKQELQQVAQGQPNQMPEPQQPDKLLAQAQQLK